MQIIEFAGFSNRPNPGSRLALYLDTETGALYQWTGSEYQAVGPFSGLACESFGASPSASAAVNSAAIQDALDVGGHVTLLTPGVYSIDQSLLVGNDTFFERTEGVTLKCVPTLSTTMFSAILNSEHATANKSIISITGSEIGSAANTGYQVMVTAEFSEAHELVAPGYVYVNGDTNDVYNGVWKIHDIPSTTTVRWIMGRSSGSTTPPAGAGTLVGCRANGHIRIEGGTIDSNFFAGGFTQANSWNDHAIVLNKVLRPHVEHLTILNTRKYGIQQGNVDHSVIRNITGNTRSDGVHTYGTAWEPVVENIYGMWGDDVCIFQPIDGPSYTQYQSVDQGGHIYSPVARNIRPKNHANSGTVVVYPNGGADTQLNYKIRGTCLFENIGPKSPLVGTWGGGTAFSIGGFYVTQPGVVDNIILRGVYGDIVLGDSGNSANCMVSAKSIVIEGWNMFTEGNAQIDVDYMTIDKLILRDCTPVNINTNKCVNLKSANATVKHLEFAGGSYAQSGAGAYNLVGSAGGTLGMCVFNGPVLGSGVHGFNDGTFANVPTFVINSVRGDTGYRSLITSGGTQSLNIVLNSPVCAAAGVGLLNLYGTGTYKIRAFGVEYSGTLFANLNGTVTMYNPDGSMPVDLTKLQRTAGQMVKTAGAYGTIPAGVMAVCDATGAANSWHALHDPTLVY